MDKDNDGRVIAHYDLDTFFVSAERRRDSGLEGKPVLIGGQSGRAVVASCSREARLFGIHAAMPMREALRLCPQAIVRRGDLEYYSTLSRIVTEIIEQLAPSYEKASIDEHYLDLTGMDRYFGSLKWAHELRLRITHETGLPISFGLSVNKTVSKIATGVAKNHTGEQSVPRGEEKPFLAPMSVIRIPGVGQQLFRSLCFKGVKRIYTLQQLEPELLEIAHGQNGLMAWKKANAIDPSPVYPYQEQKSMSREQTFEKDTTNMAILRKTILSMVADLGYELRSKGQQSGCIAIKIRYSNFDTHTKQLSIPYSCLDSELAAPALKLFERLYDRRMLIRLVGVRLSQFVTGSYQIDLFRDTDKDISLYTSLDGIRARFGYDAITTAAIL